MTHRSQGGKLTRMLGYTLLLTVCMGDFAPAQTSSWIVAWGRNAYGQLNVPAPNTGFVAVAGGYAHSLGLKADSSIVAWGGNYVHQTSVPAPNTGFVAVAAGWGHSLGLKAGGSIVGWGDNGYGQLNVPSPNTGFVAVAAGGRHSLGLKADGSIVAWGSNEYGQTDIPSPNAGFVVIAGGGFHSLGLEADGSIVAWGRDTEGQANVPVPNTGFITLAAGDYHSLGLKADGSIVGWGDNGYSQTNVPAPNTGFIVVAASGNHSLGLKGDGSIVAWGWNEYGQTNVAAPNTGFVGVAAGGSHSLGLKADGDLDGDGLLDVIDNCPLVPNPSQSDVDNDGIGDVCDNCPAFLNPGQEDTDGTPLDDLAGYWRFDELSGVTAIDSVNGLNGNVYGAQRVTGQIGGALSFDGSDDYLEVADDPILDPSASITLCAWVNVGAPTFDHQVVVSKWFALPPGQFRGSYVLELRPDGITPQFVTYHVGDFFHELLSSQTITPGVWTFLSATYDGAIKNIYVNGVQAGSDTIVGVLATNQNSLRVGSHDYFGDNNWFRGMIDEVALYAHALPANEIQRHYDNGLRRYGYTGDCIGDACDSCPMVANTNQQNSDSDTHGNACDNCVLVANENQADSDGNGVGDACEPPRAPTAPHDIPKNRYVSLAPANAGTPVALRIDKVTLPTGSGWVGAPDANGIAGVVTTMPALRVWSEPVIHVGDCEMVPVANYEIRATTDNILFTPPFVVDTIAEPVLNAKKWGDVAGSNNGSEWTAPNQFTNVNDILAVLAYINGVAIKPDFQRANLQAISSADPCLNALVNTADVLILVKAVAGDAYPFTTNPANCPVCP